MKPATKRLAGRGRASSGASACWTTPCVHDDDPLAEGHRFDLVVGDVDHGGLEPLVEGGDLGPHLHAELGVEVGERLVEEEDLRLADDRAAEGDALPLAAGELAGAAIEHAGDAEGLGGVGGAAFDLGPRRAAHLQAEGEVLPDGHVGVEGVVLEDHRDVAMAGLDFVDAAVADADFAGGDLLKPGEHAQRGALAAARGADEDDELAVGDLEIEIAHGVKAVGVVLVDVDEGDGGHAGIVCMMDFESQNGLRWQYERARSQLRLRIYANVAFHCFWRSCASFASLLLLYSFTEPSVKPETRYWLSSKNTTTTGTLTRIDAAA